MSDNIIALVIPLTMIAITFAWVPLLNFICPPRQCSSGWRRLQDAASKTQPPLLFRSRVNPADLGLHRREI
jgi:cytochrome c oxidase assembly protein Cox11